MLKLLKYEFRNNFKNIRIIFISGIIISLFINIYLQSFIPTFFYRVTNNSFDYTNWGKGGVYLYIILSFLFFISIISMFVIGIALFISIGNSLHRELNTDSGYLTFSLPISPASMIISKTIVSIIWIVGFFVSIIAVNYILSSIFVIFTKNDVYGLSYIKFKHLVIIFRMLLENILTSYYAISIMFLAVILDKRVRKTRSNSKTWILYYLGIIIFLTILAGTFYSSGGYIVETEQMSIDPMRGGLIGSFLELSVGFRGHGIFEGSIKLDNIINFVIGLAVTILNIGMIKKVEI